MRRAPPGVRSMATRSPMRRTHTGRSAPTFSVLAEGCQLAPASLQLAAVKYTVALNVFSAL